MPPAHRILLVESGSRHLVEHVLTPLRSMFGPDIEMGLVTCYQGEPAGFAGKVFRIGVMGPLATEENVQFFLKEFGKALNTEGHSI